MTTGTAPKKSIIKGVLIDALNQTITDIEFEPTLKEMYRLIRCEMIEPVRWAVPGNTLYIDEEGLHEPITNWFTLGGIHSFTGSGLIVGPPDRHGNETSATVTADEVRNLVRIFGVRTNQEVSA